MHRQAKQFYLGSRKESEVIVLATQHFTDWATLLSQFYWSLRGNKFTLKHHCETTWNHRSACGPQRTQGRCTSTLLGRELRLETLAGTCWATSAKSFKVSISSSTNKENKTLHPPFPEGLLQGLNEMFIRMRILQCKESKSVAKKLSVVMLILCLLLVTLNSRNCAF